MSTTTIPAHSAASGGTGLTFLGVLRSEWIKFRSLRSTQLLLLFTFVAVVGVGTIAAFLRGTIIDQLMKFGAERPSPGAAAGHKLTLDQAISAANAQGINIYGIPIAGLQLGILVLGALAVLLIASEFGTGMIRSTMTAVPKRLPTFFAKAIVLVVVSYVLTLVAAFVTFLVSIPILHGYGIDMSLGRDGVVYSIFMGGVYVAGVALAGLSLGTLIRSSAGGIIVLVALFFLLEIATSLLGLVPGDFWKYVGQYIPSVAGGRMLEIGDKAAFISPLSGGLIFLGWIVLVTVPAIISLKTRDV
ncbi:MULTISPECIES: ABC transporter permease [unclassified Arthrobacter]|uniref:ABC transporter permease n=1 Tax=unclassified Arthrobacter TaxID=235627 RepID=UPI00159DFB4C|nr:MULTISPECIES: ABC transporter permease [unclassified Arthrobacter]MCQ9163758.1 ABC transporter permease [Arthrobacter sp. STN4]NVM99457.1 ABC transporter permease [Arthrobacter sp. SDTb3-6]